MKTAILLFCAIALIGCQHEPYTKSIDKCRDACAKVKADYWSVTGAEGADLCACYGSTRTEYERNLFDGWEEAKEAQRLLDARAGGFSDEDVDRK